MQATPFIDEYVNKLNDITESDFDNKYDIKQILVEFGFTVMMDSAVRSELEICVENGSI